MKLESYKLRWKHTQTMHTSHKLCIAGFTQIQLVNSIDFYDCTKLVLNLILSIIFANDFPVSIVELHDL